MITDYKIKYFRNESLTDKLIIKLIDAHNELRDLKGITDENPKDYTNSHVGKQNEKRIIRIAVLIEKIKSYSDLLTT